MTPLVAEVFRASQFGSVFKIYATQHEALTSFDETFGVIAGVQKVHYDIHAGAMKTFGDGRAYPLGSARNERPASGK